MHSKPVATGAVMGKDNIYVVASIRCTEKSLLTTRATPLFYSRGGHTGTK